MKGFTLIEVLVAIVIMVILGAVTLSMFNSAWRSSRDQQRLRDLTAIKQALELYRSENGYYPTASDFAASLVPKYLPSWPSDPKAGQYYNFRTIPGSCTSAAKNCTSFALCAKQESNFGLSFFISPCLTLICSDGSFPCNMGLMSD